MYSQTLINEVKELYPHDEKMQRMAERGDDFLGRYLDGSSQESIPIDTILLATSLEELQRQARVIKRKKELYAKWCEEARNSKTFKFI